MRGESEGAEVNSMIECSCDRVVASVEELSRVLGNSILTILVRTTGFEPSVVLPITVRTLSGAQVEYVG